jgi:hypothetical protein
VTHIPVRTGRNAFPQQISEKVYQMLCAEPLRKSLNALRPVALEA